MLIRKATEKDIPEIAGLYDEIISLEEAGKTTTGWLRGVYPTYETAEAGVGRGDMFLQEDGHGNITGAAVINQIQVDCYADGKWEYPAKDSEVMVIHTLVISGSCLEKGYGSQFLSFYEDYAKEHGCILENFCISFSTFSCTFFGTFSLSSCSFHFMASSSTSSPTPSSSWIALICSLR